MCYQVPQQKWIDWIDGGVVEGLWSQWFMVHVGALYWVTGGSSDWSERTALCTHNSHTHKCTCNLMWNVGLGQILSVLNCPGWKKTNSKCQNIFTTLLGFVIWTQHQITTVMTESGVLGPLCFLTSEKVIWTKYREHKIKGFLLFVKTRDNSDTVTEYSPFWFYFLFFSPDLKLSQT